MCVIQCSIGIPTGTCKLNLYVDFSLIRVCTYRKIYFNSQQTMAGGMDRTAGAANARDGCFFSHSHVSTFCCFGVRRLCAVKECNAAKTPSESTDDSCGRNVPAPDR